MGYVDGKHRQDTEKEYVRLAKDMDLTHHVTLTVMPTTRKGRGIKSAEYAAKVVDSLAREVCDGPLIGIGDQLVGGQPHVHVLTTRRDSQKLKDAWHKAGLGHVKVTTAGDDEKAFRRMVLYVLKKWTCPSSCMTGMVFMPARQLTDRTVRRPRRTTSRTRRD